MRNRKDAQDTKTLAAIVGVACEHRDMKVSAGQRRRRLSRIAQKYDLRLVLALGSSVTGQRHPRSDLDIAVLFDQRPVDFRTQAKLSHALQKIFPELEVDLAVRGPRPKP